MPGRAFGVTGIVRVVARGFADGRRVQHMMYIIVPLGGKLTRLAIDGAEEPRRLIRLIF